jgi:hypothetical protein
MVTPFSNGQHPGARWTPLLVPAGQLYLTLDICEAHSVTNCTRYETVKANAELPVLQQHLVVQCTCLAVVLNREAHKCAVLHGLATNGVRSIARHAIRDVLAQKLVHATRAENKLAAQGA